MTNEILGCFYIAAYRAALDARRADAHRNAYRVVYDLERAYPFLGDAANYYDAERWEGK